MRRGALLVALAAALAVAGCVGLADGDLAETTAGGDDGGGDEAGPGDQGPGNGTDGAAGNETPGWASLEEARIRPGTTIAGGSCTSNFLFRSPDNSTLYLGTAAHCVDDEDLGDDVAVGGGVATGTLAYSSFGAMETEETATGNERPEIPGNDLALVEIPDGARDLVHPAMFDFGGPTGVAEDVSRGDKLLAHGNSTLRPDPHPSYAAPREGYVTDHAKWTTSAYFVAPGVPGDSGSPVLTGDGQALGVLVHLEIFPEAGSNNAANLAETLAYANEHSDRTFELVTYPIQDRGALPPR